MLNLTELQHWFGLAVIRRELDPDLLHQTVVGTEQLSAQQRMGIYAEGYRLRLLECMRAEYSCLYALLGESMFDPFAMEYLAARPSNSHTLFELGRDFPAFLTATRPAVNDPEQLRGMKMPEQLAQLERYRVMSIRGKGTERTSIEALDASLLLFQPDWVFQLADTSFVFDSDFDFVPCIDALDQQKTIPFPSYRPQSLLVYRYGYRIRLQRLEPWQAAFLQGCDGQAYWQQVQRQVADQCQLDSGELMARLITWLPEAVQKGIVAVVG